MPAVGRVPTAAPVRGISVVVAVILGRVHRAHDIGISAVPVGEIAGEAFHDDSHRFGVEAVGLGHHPFAESVRDMIGTQ